MRPAYDRPPAVRGVIDGKGAATGHNDAGLLTQRGDTFKNPVGHGTMAGKGPGHQIPFQAAAIHDPCFRDGAVDTPNPGKIAAEIINLSLDVIWLAQCIHPVAARRAASLSAVNRTAECIDMPHKVFPGKVGPFFPVGILLLAGDRGNPCFFYKGSGTSITVTGGAGPVFAIHPKAVNVIGIDDFFHLWN